MKLIILLLLSPWVVDTACAESKPNADAMRSPAIVTASRVWRMADGTTQRLRFTGLRGNEDYGYFQSATANTGFRLNLFSKEEAEFFKAFREGSIRLVSNSNLCMNPDFPGGKITAKMKTDNAYFLGETRTWENLNGKRIESQLICLTDEHVSLFNGDSVGRVAIQDLSPSDLAYLNRLKHGEEKLYPMRVEIGGFGWDGAPGYKIALSGEHYEELTKKGSGFEQALAAVMRHVRSKIDPDLYELGYFSEERALVARGKRNIGLSASDSPKVPYYYVAEFYLKKNGVVQSRQIYPLSTTPKCWPGAPMLKVYALANGEILIPEPSR